MSYEDFISRLDPKTASRVRTAAEVEVTRLPLASYGLTKKLNGGIGKGRITLIYGNQSSGKSLLMLQSIAAWQREGLVCAWVDSEGAFDKEWAARLGVNVKELILIHSKSSGRIEKETAPLLSNKIDVLVVDSISDIMPEVFIGKDGALNDQEDRKQLGAHAKAITALVNGFLFLNDDTAVVLLSQTTTFIGQTYVQQVPHGGKKVLFAASQIVRLTSSNTDAKQIKGDVWVGETLLQEPIGRTTEYFVEKNKLGKQHGVGEYDMYYGGTSLGIDTIGEVIKEAVRYTVITKAGAWFKWNGEQWQGESKTTTYFKENPEQFELLKKQIRELETGEVEDDPAAF